MAGLLLAVPERVTTIVGLAVAVRIYVLAALLHRAGRFAVFRPVAMPAVAQGLLGLVLSNGLSNGCIPSHRGIAAIVAFLGIEAGSFRGPIRIGDTIRIVTRVVEKRRTRSPDRGLVVFEQAVVNQDGRTVQDGRKTYLIATHPGGGRS